ncbi:hypothetical protein [Streptomyces narbonensis]|uniref:hypothetical protein n=1 Tax=Streptomyces narbonensis TaxID=67333 RepID=UPI00167AD351|nr:hypothetical protein [Streptomyces narbonensis]GGW01343.1 hypothetical protein GCM10010230_31500 [Streptomyces narbonensis]
MTDEARVLLRVAGVLAMVVVAVAGADVYEIIADRDGTVALDVAEVERVWVAEDDGDARLVVRGDGSAELTPEAQLDACGWALGRDNGRTLRATWAFGDSDEPRMVFLELQDPDTAEPCYFDLYVADSSGRATLSGEGAFATYARSDSLHRPAEPTTP